MKPLVDLFRIESDIQHAKLQGKYQIALQLYDRAIEIKSHLPNRLGLAKTIAEKAFLLESCGQNQAALESYCYAKQLMEKSPNREFVESINQHMINLTKIM